MSFEEMKKSLDATAAATVAMRESFESKSKELEKAVGDVEAAKAIVQEFGEIKARQDDITTQLERIDALELSMKRSKAIDNAMNITVPNDQKKHYDALYGRDGFMRKGNEHELITELKAMSSLNDADGGYLVPKVTSDRISSIIYETSGVRDLAYVEMISSKSLEMMVDNDEADAGWVGETQTRSTTDTPQIGMLEIPVREVYAEPKVTQTLLDDSVWDVEAWLARKVAAKFARYENEAFVSGNSVLRPKGFLTYTAGTSATAQQIEQIAGGDATAITEDLPIKLEGALKADYRNGAQYVMNRTTENKVRLLKDGMGNYMWQPSYQLGQPRTLNGYAYKLFNDMPAVEAGALALAFGNFKEAYTIVDRMGIRVLRDNLTAKGYIKFYTTKRVGGAVTNFEAIKLGKIAVS